MVSQPAAYKTIKYRIMYTVSHLEEFGWYPLIIMVKSFARFYIRVSIVTKSNSDPFRPSLPWYDGFPQLSATFFLRGI